MKNFALPSLKKAKTYRGKGGGWIRFFKNFALNKSHTKTFKKKFSYFILSLRRPRKKILKIIPNRLDRKYEKITKNY